MNECMTLTTETKILSINKTYKCFLSMSYVESNKSWEARSEELLSSF